MAVSLKHQFASPIADSGNSDLVGPDEWNAEHVLTQAGERLLGKTSAGEGSTGELTATQVRAFLNVEDGSTADQSAAEVPFTPAGDLSATDVQAALEELDSEKAPLASPALTGTPTAPTAAPGTDTTQIATTAFTQAAVAALVDSAPAALDTLNELAAALGDDENFSTTVTNALATKAASSDLASTSNGEGASLIGIEDSAGNFDSGTVEGALAELAGGGALSAANITALKALAANAAPTVTLLGYASAGDGGNGEFHWDASDLSTEVSADTENGLYVPPDSDNTGASGAWVRPAARPRSLRQWNAAWFGLIDHATTDQTEVLQKIIDAYDPADGSIEVSFPPGQVVLNGGGTDSPLIIDKHGVNLKLNRDTIFTKTVADRRMMRVGSISGVTEGNRIQNFSFRGGQIDGGSLEDTSDDYSAIHMEYVDGGVVEDVLAYDIGTFARIGRGLLEWGVEVRSSRNCAIRNCIGRNLQFFFAEAHGADIFHITDNKVEGGALSDTQQSIAIRCATHRRGDVSRNIITGMGRGIGTSSDVGEDNLYSRFHNNIVQGPIWGSAFSLSGDHNFSSVVGNLFYGAGNDAQNIVSIVGASSSMSDFLYAHNQHVSNRAEIKAAILFSQIGRLDCIGNMYRSLGIATSTGNVAMRFQECWGLINIDGGSLYWDTGLGIEDLDGQSSLEMVVKNVTFKGPGVVADKTVAVSQNSSSGTVYLGGEAGDSNIYLDE